MHKDKSPGLFEFASRSSRHAVAFGLATGAVLSILVYIAFSLWGVDSATRARPASPEGLEQTVSDVDGQR